jgi:Kdo2-lipid IVA lauroyltransferase/acyltransferase
MGVLGFRTYAIARPLDNVFLNAFINRFRGGSGQQIIPKDGCAPLVDALMAQQGALGFMVDTHAGPKGCYVDFFGRPVSTHKAIAVFAIGYQAPMVMCFGRRKGRLFEHFLGAFSGVDPQLLQGREATVSALTQWFTSQLEIIVREDPTQYWWLHRRWKDTREKKQPATKMAA